jgi:single-stranded-DNA-specific exonuclease
LPGFNFRISAAQGVEGFNLEMKWIWPQASKESESSMPGFSRIESEILKSRGFQDPSKAEEFLSHANLIESDPFLLVGMKEAVERLVLALEKQERVLVYGDYDADGITATAVLVEVFREIGLDTGYFIPDRITQGYGLHSNVLRDFRENGVDLVVSVDCGIRAVDAVEVANSIGLDVIVTDHHELGERMPDAFAIINPKQASDPYPFKGFAGVGLAYKLAIGLATETKHEPEKSLLDLVALGTVADLAPLVDENRALVIGGLEKLKSTSRSGLVALSQAAGLSGRSIGTETIAFGLAPRINAIGRLDDASKAVDLLLTDDVALAFKLATELDQTNRKRQKMTSDIVGLARMKIEEGLEFGDILFVGDESFHEGIIGLAASRLSDEYSRPAIVANTRDEVTRASARSIPGFNITGALEACSELLIRYGGHKAAAGFSLLTENIYQFQQKINQVARETISEMDRIPTVEIDTEVNLNELNFNLLSFLDKVQPCGIGNPVPLLGARGVRVESSRLVGKERKHLKLMLKQGGQIFDSIAFNQGSMIRKLTPTIDVAFHFERNDYMGIEGRQLNVQAINPN